MDKLVNSIQSLSGSDQELKNLKTLLNKEENVISKNISNLDEVLTVLDPAAHSLGWAYILAAKAASSKLDSGKFIAQVTKFSNSAISNQIRFAPLKVSIIARRFADVLTENQQPIKGVKVLRTLVRKMKPNSESLTPIHANFFQLCLLSKCYSAALSVLDEEIFEVNPEATAVTPKDMLLYYYYGGMLFVGLKQYKKAFNFFKQAVCAPALALSQIMIESYKKYILLSLIVNGKLSSLPKYASAVMQRFHKTAVPAYTEFATSFSTQSTDDLHKCAELHVEAFTKDKNFGLVKQCIQSLYRRNIQRFTQTYITFSLPDIATSVKLSSAKEAEKQIMKMVEAGEIFAMINQKDGMVSFQESSEQYDTNSVLKNLDQQIQKVIDIGKKVRTLDETISSSTGYLQKTAMSERGGANRWADYGEDFEAERPGAKFM